MSHLSFEMENICSEKRNLLYTSAIAITVAKMNEESTAFFYTHYNGRGDYYKMSSCGLYTASLPIFIKLNEQKTSDMLLKEIANQIDYGSAHTIYDHISNLDVERAKVAEVIYQKDTLDYGVFGNIVEKRIELREIKDKPSGTFEIDIVEDDTANKLSLIFEYSDGYYSQEFVERFYKRFCATLRWLNKSVNFHLN